MVNFRSKNCFLFWLTAKYFTQALNTSDSFHLKQNKGLTCLSSEIPLASSNRFRSASWKRKLQTSDQWSLRWTASHGGAGLAQWWEHSSPTNVAQVRFPDSASYVGWVCWFSTLHREVFSGYSGFPSPQKPTFDLICVNLLITILQCPRLVLYGARRLNT